VNTKCAQVLLANITNTKADLPQMPQPHLHHWLGAELQKLSGPWQGFAQELKALPYQFAGVHAHSRDVAIRPSKASHKSLVDGIGAGNEKSCQNGATQFTLRAVRRIGSSRKIRRALRWYAKQKKTGVVSRLC